MRSCSTTAASTPYSRASTNADRCSDLPLPINSHILAAVAFSPWKPPVAILAINVSSRLASATTDGGIDTARLRTRAEVSLRIVRLQTLCRALERPGPASITAFEPASHSRRNAAQFGAAMNHPVNAVFGAL